MAALLSVGGLAERTGVPGSTLRYYDRIGLLKAQRDGNGHRRYPEHAVSTLELIEVCRGLGCTLDEVGVLLRSGTAAARRDLARSKLVEVTQRLRDLEAAQAVLAHVARCRHELDEGERCRRACIRAAHTAAGSSAPGSPART